MCVPDLLTSATSGVFVPLSFPSGFRQLLRINLVVVVRSNSFCYYHLPQVHRKEGWPPSPREEAQLLDL